MKNYPEPNGRGWAIAEQVMMWIAAGGLVAAVYFAAYFARNILGV